MQPDPMPGLAEPSSGHHIEVVHEPHRQLPVQVWMRGVLLAELPSEEYLVRLNREHVLQRLRHRVLAALSQGQPG